MEVSWEVKGVRCDPFANENRIKVEENKKGEYVGKYLYPEVYNLPLSAKIKEY